MKSSNHTLNLHKLTSCTPSTNFPWLSPNETWLIPELNEFCHLYNQGMYTHHKKHMSRGFGWRHLGHGKHSFLYCCCWIVCTELLPGNALIKSVNNISLQIFSDHYFSRLLTLICSVNVSINWRKYIKMASIKFAYCSSTGFWLF
jgi:hypothetical protein